MELSTTRLDRLVIPIEFIVEDLNSILGTNHIGLELYTSPKELQFNCFSYVDAVRNIYIHRDLSDDVCSLPFQSQLLPMQIRILHSILQHIVTPRKQHSDEVTRLDVGLLDCLFRRRPVNLGYIILHHMLSTLAVNNKLLPYGSIISRILRHFQIPIIEPVYKETKRLGGEIILGIDFRRRNGEWVKITSSRAGKILLDPIARHEHDTNKWVWVVEFNMNIKWVGSGSTRFFFALG